MTQALKTYFASAERESDAELELSLRTISNNPVIAGVLKSVSGLIAVLNEQRQILAANEEMLRSLGISDGKELFGFRLGEAISCVHHAEGPGGCGTGVACRSCGAVLAMIGALAGDRPVEKDCVAKVGNGKETRDLVFQVRVVPIHVAEHAYLLVFLWDKTGDRQRAQLEQIFFHDIANVLHGAMTFAELSLLDEDISREEILDQMQRFTKRLNSEMNIQKTLVANDAESFPVKRERVSADSLVTEIRESVDSLLRAMSCELCCSDLDGGRNSMMLLTDPLLVVRILTNMIVNAVEASSPGEILRLNVESEGGEITFAVRNRAAIPADLRPRVFQRNFTTKKQPGHGLGTFSMKFFGEKVLGGKVGFHSSEEEGTCFWLTLPKAPDSP